MPDHDEDFYDDEDMCTCPRCMGMGALDCDCGGDICVCDNYGTADCPVCLGEGEVTQARWDRYFGKRKEAPNA